MRQTVARVLVGFLLTLCGSSYAQSGAQAWPGLNQSLDELKSEMFHVSAGRRLKPQAWPNGARVAVVLSFDVDNASAELGRGILGSEPLSRGEYGAVDGLPRILAILDRQNVPASFYVPAVSALLHPKIIPSILAARQHHEIGVHGWIHEDASMLNDEKREQELLNRSIEYLTKATGRRPVGYRAPYWHLSPFTMKQVRAAGFLYDSSLMSSDDPYEVSLDGQPTGVVELPIERIVDDYPYFGGTNGNLPSPELVRQIFESEFDVAYQEGGLFVLTMHPDVTGHRSRAAELEKLIAHMKAKGQVWFATAEQVANYVKQAASSSANQPAPETSVAEVYFWKAKPGKFDEYARYIRDFAEPIDEEARRQGAFLSVTTYVNSRADAPWTHMRVFLLRDRAQQAALGAALDAARLRLHPDEAERARAAAYAETLRDLAGHETVELH